MQGLSRVASYCQIIVCHWLVLRLLAASRQTISFLLRKTVRIRKPSSSPLNSGTLDLEEIDELNGSRRVAVAVRGDLSSASFALELSAVESSLYHPDGVSLERINIFFISGISTVLAARADAFSNSPRIWPTKRPHHRSFTVCSRRLVGQIWSLQSGRSLFGFARPAL